MLKSFFCSYPVLLQIEKMSATRSSANQDVANT
ncbi:hypothetical protein BDA96_02G175200 [Sorghum bicolor]|nr:hypothetical protein BDA96_02G175200 [Sorghum bicolor]